MSPHDESPVDGRPIGVRVLRAALVVVAAVAGLLVVIILALQLDPVGTWVGRRVARMVVPESIDVSIGNVSGSWIRSLRIVDLHLTGPTGDTVVGIDTLQARFRLLPLFRRRLDVRSLRLAEPVLLLARRSDGATGIQGWRPGPPPDTTAAPWRIDIGRLAVRGAAGRLTTPLDSAARPRTDVDDGALDDGAAQDRLHREVALAWSGVDIAMSDLTTTDLSFDLESATGRLDVPTLPEDAGVGPLDFSLDAQLGDRSFHVQALRLTGPGSSVTGGGTLALPDSSGAPTAVDFDLDVESFPLAVVHAYLGNEPDGADRLDATVSIGGTTAFLTADVQARTPDGGSITGSAAFTPAGGDDVHYRADLTIASIDPAVFTGDTAMAGTVDGSLDVDLEGPAMARLSGHAGATFTRLAVGPAALRDMRLESSWDAGRADVRLGGQGDDFSADISGTAHPLGDPPSYDLAGPFTLRVPGDSSDLATMAGTLDIEGSGVSLDSADLHATARLSRLTLLSARLESGTIDANVERGRVAWTVDLQDNGPGSLRANGSVAFGDPMTFRVDHGAIRDFDIAAVIGDTVPSMLDADVTAAGEIGAPDAAESDIRLTIRDGRYGALTIDTTAVNAVLADGVLTATGRAVSNAGRLGFDVRARPFAEVPEFDIDRLRFAGIDLGAVSADTTLSTDLAGTASGSGRGSGLEQLVLDLSVSLDSSRINRQPLSGGSARVALRDSTASIATDLAFADSGGIQLEIEGRPFGNRPTFDIRRARFRALDPFALGGFGSGTASLTGGVDGSIAGLDPRTMSSQGTLRLDASTFNAQPVSGGRLDWNVRDAALTANADFDLPEGELTADASVAFTEDEPAYDISGALRSGHVGELAGFDTLTGSIDAIFAINGRGSSLATMNTRLRATADGATLGDVVVDTLRLAVLVESGVATVDTLTLRSNFADATGGGTITVSDSARAVRSDFELLATIKSLDPVERWLNMHPVGLGTGTVRVAVAGPADSLRVDASANASAVLLGRNQLVGLESTFEGRLTSGLQLLTASGHVELDRLSLGNFDVQLSSLDGSWDGDELALGGDATLDERRDVTFSTRIDPRPENASAELERLDIRVDQDNWKLDGTPSVSWARGIRFDSLSLGAGDQRITLNGLLDLDGRSDLAARISELRIGAIADLVGYPDLNGTMTASFDVQGPAADPRLTGGVDATLDWRNGQSSSLVASLSYDTLRLDLDARIAADQGGLLTVEGGLPIDLALTRAAEGDTTTLFAAAPGSVDLAVRADSFGVQWVEPFLPNGLASGLDGQLQIDARVGGSQAEPTLSGFVKLAGGRMTIPRLGVTYHDADVSVTLRDNVARIDSGSVIAGGGTAVLDGEVSLPELSLGEFNIDARLNEFRAIYNDVYRVSASGTAGLSGTTKEPRLEGDVQLVETDIYLGNRVATASVRPVELTDEQIRELEDYLGIPLQRPNRDSNALYEALTIDMSVSMSRDTWVRQRSNPTLEVQLTGDVQVMKQPQDSLRFDGRIEAISRRSYVEQFGKRFRINQGVVELQGTPAEAEIDIRAVYRVPSNRDPNQAEVTITLDIGGTLNDLSLTLGSEPQLENADIVSYLATGRPAATSLDFSQGGNGSDFSTLGSELAFGQVTGLVEGLAAESIGLDVIEIQPDGLRGATLIAGRYVSPSLFVGFKQPIGRDPDNADSSTGFERTEVQLEYEAYRWLLLNMEASSSAVSFLLRYRHAY